VTVPLLLLISVSALAVAAYFAAEAATAPARQRSLGIRRAATYGRVRLASRPGAERFGERVVDPLKARLAGWTLRLNPKASVESAAAKLLSAGMARSLSPQGFLAAKAAAAIGGLVLGVAVGSSMSGPLGGMLFAVMAAAVGFIVPDYVVGSRARRRRETIRAELPDALDLLTVSVEAGLGFDGAVAKLIDHMDGPLVEEFELTLNEMRIGESRQDALKRMATRVDAPEVQAFTRAIVQSDQLGMSLGRILRVQAADSRLRRQAAAEERAMKAPIKMLFPTVMFIFPAMFIVVLGPAFLALLELF
jgi:tight adherence protein C